MRVPRLVKKSSVAAAQKESRTESSGLEYILEILIQESNEEAWYKAGGSRKHSLVWRICKKFQERGRNHVRQI